MDASTRARAGECLRCGGPTRAVRDRPVDRSPRMRPECPRCGAA